MGFVAGISVFRNSVLCSNWKSSPSFSHGSGLSWLKLQRNFLYFRFFLKKQKKIRYLALSAAALTWTQEFDPHKVHFFLNYNNLPVLSIFQGFIP